MAYRPFNKLRKPSAFSDPHLKRVVWTIPPSLVPVVQSLLSTLEWETEGTEEWETARDRLLSLPGFPHREIGFPNVDPNLHLVITTSD